MNLTSDEVEAWAQDMEKHMPLSRWVELNDSEGNRLTSEEIDAGWHFCPDWDGLLIGPGMREMELCLCGKGEGE